MLTDSAFATRKLDANTALLNLLLEYRGVRTRKWKWTPEGMVFYEDGMIALRGLLGEIEAEYDARFAAAVDLLDRMAGVLRRNLPARASGQDIAELGDVLDGLLAMNQARGVLTAAPTAAEPSQVYQPEENRPVGFLADMAVPADIGVDMAASALRPALKPISIDNVLPFRGVRQPQGGGA